MYRMLYVIGLPQFLHLMLKDFEKHKITAGPPEGDGKNTSVGATENVNDTLFVKKLSNKLSYSFEHFNRNRKWKTNRHNTGF